MARRSSGRVAVATVLAAVLIAVGPDLASAQAHFDEYTEAGDAIQVLLPAGALATTLILRDREGTREFAVGGAVSLAVVHGAKYLSGRARPGQSEYNSFPSGHTAAAFYGAGFIHRRYGWDWAVPCYIAAAYVGFSRVHANRHWGDDVFAGATVGLVTNWVLTTEWKDRVTLVPDLRSDGYALSLEISW